MSRIIPQKRISLHSAPAEIESSIGISVPSFLTATDSTGFSITGCFPVVKLAANFPCSDSFSLCFKSNAAGFPIISCSSYPKSFCAARLKKTIPNTQILALSATISNANEIAEWLEAELVQTDWRPVKLSEGVYWKGVVEFNTGRQIRIPIVSTKHPEINIVYDTIKNEAQALVFANTRASSQATAERIGQQISRLLTGEEKEQLALVADELLTTGEKTKLTERLVKARERVMQL